MGCGLEWVQGSMCYMGVHTGPTWRMRLNHGRRPCKTAEPIEMPFAPCHGAIFRGKDMPGHARRHSAVSGAKLAEPIEMLFGLWTRLGRRKHVLRGVHTGATWRIPSNRPCAASMPPVCQITLTTVQKMTTLTTCCYYSEINVKNSKV